MFNRKRDVVFVLAPSFHGATLLSLILSNHSKIASLADTLPSAEFEQDCGCKTNISACHFWQELANRSQIRGRKNLFLEYPDFIPGFNTLNQTISFGIGFILNKLSIPYRGKFSQQYDVFFEYVTSYYNKSILVDGFKSLNRYLFVKASGYNVIAVIHLIRDPRAFVASTLKNTDFDIEQAIKIYNSYHINTTRVLDSLNETVIQVKYEDLTSTPESVIESVLNKTGVGSENLLHPISGDVHWLGNISLRDFTGEIYKNEKWKESLSEQQQSYIFDKTAMLCDRFGYVK